MGAFSIPDEWRISDQGRELHATILASKFLELAAKFDDFARSRGRAGGQNLRDLAGRLIIEAVHSDFLQSFPCLAELVTFYSGEDLEAKLRSDGRPRQATLARTPFNLFLDFVGNTSIVCHPSGLNLPATSDGILASMSPAAFGNVLPVPHEDDDAETMEKMWSARDAASAELEAQACRLLAEAIKPSPIRAKRRVGT